MEDRSKEKTTLLAVKKDIAGTYSVWMAEDAVGTMMSLYKALAAEDGAALKVFSGALAMYVADFDGQGRKAFLSDFKKLVNALEKR